MQLGLQVVEPLFRPLSCGDVVDEPGKAPPFAGAGFTDCELKRKRAAVSPLADNDAAGADDALLTRGFITGEISVVFAPVR